MWRNRRVLSTGAWVGVAVLACYAAFVLPFRFPPKVPVMSSAFAAGENNKVAAIAEALLSVLVAWGCWRFGRFESREQGAEEKLGRGWLWGAMAAVVVFTLGLGWAMVRARLYYGEAGYFLTQLETGIRLHREVYRGFEFAYGPLLYWWPRLWVEGLAPLGISLAGAYVGALAAMQAAGMAMLFYVMNALPMSGWLRRFGFAMVALGSLSVTLGMNYSLFRFMVPLAAVGALSRFGRAGWAAGFAGLGTMACFATSPEMGIAFGGGAIAYGIYRGAVSHWRWSGVSLGVVAGGTMFLGALGWEALDTLRRMANGGFNLILTPEPRTLVLLVAMVGLVPVAVARWVRRGGEAAKTGMLLGLYGVSLGLLPVALGRCDAIHGFFDGIGAYLLSLVAIRQTNGWARRAWIAALAGLMVMSQRATLRLYGPELEVLRTPAAAQADDPFDVAGMVSALGGKSVVFAEALSWPRMEEFIARGTVVPSYFVGMSSVFDRATEERKIAEMRGAEFALAIQGGFGGERPFEDVSVRRWRRLGLVYRQRQQPYEPGLLLDRELAENWVLVRRSGYYELYRRMR